MTVNFLLGFATAALVLQIIRLAVNSWQHSRKARQLGCSSPPRFPCRDPIGYGNLKQSLAADKAKCIPKMAEKRVEIMSERENRHVTTFTLDMMGVDNVFTVDPKNVQALLATQFKDFELGDSRRRTAHQLLGTGIVSYMHFNPPNKMGVDTDWP